MVTGRVTEAEWIASKYQPAARFKLNDLDGDGVLTPYEHSLRWGAVSSWARSQVEEREAARNDLRDNSPAW